MLSTYNTTRIPSRGVGLWPIWIALGDSCFFPGDVTALSGPRRVCCTYRMGTYLRLSSARRLRSPRRRLMILTMWTRRMATMIVIVMTLRVILPTRSQTRRISRRLLRLAALGRMALRPRLRLIGTEAGRRLRGSTLAPHGTPHYTWQIFLTSRGPRSNTALRLPPSSCRTRTLTPCVSTGLGHQPG